MHQVIRSSVGLGLALASWHGAQARESNQEPPVDEVVVTATRVALPASALPSTFQVIDKATLDVQAQLGGSAVDAVSALLPSFSPTRQKLSGFGESLRGRSPLYLIDGVPQTSPLRDDSRDGFTLDPFFIERVEVIFGSNAIQGIGATGGVVNYLTPPAPAVEGEWTGATLVQMTTTDELDSDGHGYKIAGRIAHDFGRFDATLGTAHETRGTYYDAEGRLIGQDGTQGETQDSESLSLFGRFGADLGDARRLELMVNRFELEGNGDYVAVEGSPDLGIPTTAERGTPPGISPRNEVMTVSLTYTDSDLFGGHLSGQLFYNDYEGVFGGGTFGTFQDPSIAPPGTLFDQSANNSKKHGFKLSYERALELSGFRYVAGVDGLQDETFQALALTGRQWVPETTFEGVAPFIQLHQRLMDERLHLAAGVRHEKARIEVDDYTTLASYGSQQVRGGRPEFDETLVNYGATFKVVAGLTVYASHAQGFTMPDVGRVLRGINVPGQDIDTFLDVTPVVSDNTELGMEFKHGPFDFSAAYFWSESDRGQLLVPVDGIFEVQRQRTEIEGLELSARWITPFDGLTLSSSYAALNGRTDSDGDGVVDVDLDGSNISPDRALLAADYAVGDWSMRLQGQFYRERTFQGGDPLNDFQGYALADLFVRYDSRIGALSFGVQNLLDKQYITYYSDTVRPTDDLRYFAGRGRVLSASLQKQF